MDESVSLMGVDGGQTATRALIARCDGTIIGRGAGGPMVHFHAEGGLARNRMSIHAAILGACRDAGVRAQSVCSIALGLTGVQLDAPEARTVESLVREVLSPESVRVVPDYVTSLAGAARGAPGIVVIAGGGSIAYGVSSSGCDALAGGYGYLLGDEGSGFDIGRQAVMAAIRASEGRATRTVLQTSVMQQFQVADMRQLVRLVYDASFSRERLSQLTPLVVLAAQQGDGVALHILKRAGHDLARVCLAVIRRLHAPGECPSVYLAGGVWSAGDMVREPFRSFLGRCWGPVDIRLPLASSAEGALILAAQRTALA